MLSLSRAVVPLIQGFEDAGDFTVTERLKTSIHANLVFYLIVGAIGLFGLILLIMMNKIKSGVLGFAMACSNTFGLVTGAFLLGFGLSEIPKSLWRNADWITRQKVLSHKIAKMAVKLDDAHQELSNAIVVAQATSNQMSKRDPLRPYMDVIDNMLAQMFREDPSFKPQGGRLGENDMDYDTDEKSMATLRRNLRGAREGYYRYKSEYMTYVSEALELEDTIKNYERGSSTGWKYISSFRPVRTGKLGALFETMEFFWRCILNKQFKKLLAIILGTMSGAILLAEATLLPTGVNLSLFSLFINSVGKQELLMQVLAFIPLMYMCICTYYSLFKIGMLMFYSFTPRQTSSVSLLMICSMVARYAPPISYNFLNLINLKAETIFEKRMGKIDKAVPFFGDGFNRIYPLIMVIYTLLVASNFFDRVIGFFNDLGWNKDKKLASMLYHWQETSIVWILNLAAITHFVTNSEVYLIWSYHLTIIILLFSYIFETVAEIVCCFLTLKETFQERTAVEMKSTTSSVTDAAKGSSSTPLKEEGRRYSSSRDAISNKYAAMREQSRHTNTRPVEKSIASAKVSLLDAGNSESNNTTVGPSSGLATKWESMKNGFQSFKANIGAKRFLPLRQMQESKLVSRNSSSESLDEIFQRLKRPSNEHRSNSDDDEDANGMASGPGR
ncbi:conserved hypothetical protein [Ricinus communis]|uniref:Uncharacterized protein n=1 Tax=Ricinus communis TaxID=3988 RepID=B9T8F4_RICCO|nr:conserved hypothetical protein [Ricinus communis]